MNKVTIKYGLLGRVEKEVPEGTTVGQVIRDPNVRGVLGYGEAVRPVIQGLEVEEDRPILDGDIITVDKKAASKAA